MTSALSRDLRPGQAGHPRRAGVTLVEVLAAIFIMGVGLLALLNLFSLGALQLAQAVKDDRTAAVYASALALNENGEDLLSRTADFLEVALSQGSADPKAAAQLREEHGEPAEKAGGLEA